jgi:dTMP kinase
LERAVSRRQAAGLDRFERERAGFFERIRAAYLRRATAEPGRFCVVDASRSAAEVRRDVLAAVLGP